MNNQNFSTTFLVEQTPQEVFEAITNVRGWWSENVVGSTDTLNSEFDYGYQDMHVARIRVAELVPGQKVVYLVKKNYFKFTKDPAEWTNTKLIFDIQSKGEKTEVRFTHEGLTPAYECYDVCSEAWTHYMTESLRSLITKGKGEPSPMEGGFNAEIIAKHNL